MKIPGLGEKLPAKFFPLTLYDNEVARGLLHTAEWDQKMTKLLDEFEAYVAKQIKQMPSEPEER